MCLKNYGRVVYAMRRRRGEPSVIWHLTFSCIYDLSALSSWKSVHHLILNLQFSLKSVKIIRSICAYLLRRIIRIARKLFSCLILIRSKHLRHCNCKIEEVCYGYLPASNNGHENSGQSNHHVYNVWNKFNGNYHRHPVEHLRSNRLSVVWTAELSIWQSARSTRDNSDAEAASKKLSAYYRWDALTIVLAIFGARPNPRQC